MPKIGYQSQYEHKKTICEKIAKETFDDGSSRFIGVPNVGRVYDLLDNGTIDFGVIPLKNSKTGKLKNLDMFFQRKHVPFLINKEDVYEEDGSFTTVGIYYL